MFGKGLLKGLSVTGKEAVSKRMTEKYPEEKPYLADCFRGSDFILHIDRCIACGICAKSCPNRAIEIVTEKNEEGKKQLKEYWVDRQYCLFCGFCVDACPKDALQFTMDFETAVYSRFDVPVDLVATPHLDRRGSSYGMKGSRMAVKKTPVEQNHAGRMPASEKGAE